MMLWMHSHLVSAEGAGTWLHAAPTPETGRAMDGELYRASLRRRLRTPFLEEPTSCPCCGAGLDIFMDHALVCPCKGDRNLRHKALRDLTYGLALEAGLNPQKEKQGLLSPRPEAEGL